MADSKKGFVRDNDGIIIYDETDDLFTDELTDESGNELMSNRDIFTDEYMLALADEFDADNARHERIQRLISIGVIVGSLLIIALFTILAIYQYI